MQASSNTLTDIHRRRRKAKLCLPVPPTELTNDSNPDKSSLTNLSALSCTQLAGRKQCDSQDPFSSIWAPGTTLILPYQTPAAFTFSTGPFTSQPPSSPILTGPAASVAPTYHGPLSSLSPYEAPKRTLSITDLKPIKFLGKGAHGQVYLVYDSVSCRELALKVINKDGLQPSYYSQIFEEQYVCRKLMDCPWAVRLEGSFQDHDHFYLLFEYHAGGDLAKEMRLKGTLLPFTVVRKYTAELIVAVEEIHRLSIMHRDLKLDNILIDDTGHLVLADFGVAKSFTERPLSRPWDQSGASTKRQQASRPREEGLNDTTVTSCGTPGFIAPEVHSKFYSYEADIWSIGVILHYLLLGRLPFGMNPGTQSYKELAARTNILDVEFAPEERIGAHSRRLLRRMLEKDPCKRITILEIKAHDFFGAIDWDQIAQRSTKDKKFFQYGVGSSPNEPPIDIPSSEAYKQGQVPFPWFEYASPVLHKVVQDSPLLNEDSPSKVTSVNNDIHGKTTPVKLVRRLKGIWSRSPKSPDVEAL